jgi:hypothetical protein
MRVGDLGGSLAAPHGLQRDIRFEEVDQTVEHEGLLRRVVDARSGEDVGASMEITLDAA